MMRHVLSTVAAFSLILTPALAWAQDSARQLRVFLDCEGCFADFLREELAFVDFVRDRTEAEVHVIVTDAETAGGGREYSANFIGQRELATANRRLKTITASADSDD